MPCAGVTRVSITPLRGEAAAPRDRDEIVRDRDLPVRPFELVSMRRRQEVEDVDREFRAAFQQMPEQQPAGSMFREAQVVALDQGPVASLADGADLDGGDLVAGTQIGRQKPALPGET